jgi:hypothetical protein
MQNYPNPFNPSTKISFTVDEAAFTTLKVYNILGQEITTLFEGIAEPGPVHIVSFEGRNLANGAYIYRLESGSKVEVKKMILLK